MPFKPKDLLSGTSQQTSGRCPITGAPVGTVKRPLDSEFKVTKAVNVEMPKGMRSDEDFWGVGGLEEISKRM